MMEHWGSSQAAIVGASQGEHETVMRQMEVRVSQDGAMLQHHDSDVGCLKSTHRHTEQQDLRLQFRNKLALPLFTRSKVEGEQGSAIHVVLQNVNTGHVVTTGSEASAKLDIVVLEGDFTAGDEENWTQEDFENYVVRERDGKRPLLTGELSVTLKDGVGTLGELTFTDNSSWIRSRKFRLGVRIASGTLEGVRIREAKTEAFTVKVHRGLNYIRQQLYKKHYPPALHDEVWRLDKIGKDGAFHKRLNQAHIKSVEDFLRQVVMDPQRLRNILGNGMSNKMWEGTVEHAKTCVLSGKLHVYYAGEKQNIGVIFNNIFQQMGIIADGSYMSVDSFSDSEKFYADKLVKVAYENWENVVEYDGEVLIGVKNHQAKGFDSHTLGDPLENLLEDLLEDPPEDPLKDPLGGLNFHSQGVSLDGYESVSVDGYESLSVDGYENLSLDGYDSVSVDGYDSVSLDGYESEQRNYWGELNIWKPRGVDTVHGAGHGDHVPLGNEPQFTVTYYSPWAATKPAHNQAVVETTVHNYEGLPVSSLSSPKMEKRKRDSNWADEETSILVKCKKEAAVDNGSRFCKGKRDVTNWDAIAEEINSSMGTTSTSKTGDQCRLRWDTLVKSYRRVKEHCRSSNKEFPELTRKERVELKLATTLSNVEWYEVIDQFCPPKPRKSKSQKPDNVAPNVEALSRSLHNSTHFRSPIEIGIGSFEARESSTKEAGAMQDIAGFSATSSDLNPVASGPPVKIDVGSLEPHESRGRELGLAQGVLGCSVMNEDLNPVGFSLTIPIQSPDSEPKQSSRKQVAIPGFNSMSRDLKSTILNLVQAWPTLSISCKMEKVCRWLAIVQDRSPSETRSYVFKLLSRNLLAISSGSQGACKLKLKLSHLRVYKKFVKVVISKNLDYNIHSRILQDDSMLSFTSSSVLQGIQVLTLYKCDKMKRIDLGKLPMLRSLSIKCCDGFNEIFGWENLSELGWLEISECDQLRNEHLRVHCLPSLKEFSLDQSFSDASEHSTGFKLDFSQCLQLHRVKLQEVDMATTVDLSTLKCLEKLNFSWCPFLESVVGLSELHALTTVTLFKCGALKRLPCLDHFKALAKLDLSFSNVESITGFEDLLSLTHLTLRDCSALKRLPELGGLKALCCLKISLTDVDEIQGLDKLHSLTDLVLHQCKALKRLPYLGHLKALVHLDISHSGVDEIPGVSELVNLERLYCNGSQLEWLPDLSHLPRLKRVVLYDTPLVRVPSSKYFEKIELNFNDGVKWAEVVNDLSDPNYVPSDQEVYDEKEYWESSDGSDSDG